MELDSKLIDSMLKKSKQIAFGITKNYADAEDIAQQCLIKLLTSDEKDIKNPENWIKSVAKNMSIDQLRMNNKDITIIKEYKKIPISKSVPGTKIKNEVLDKFYKSGKLKIFTKENNLTYNQAKDMVYAAKKNVKAELMLKNEIDTDLFSYSQGKVINKIINKYIQCSIDNSNKPLKRFLLPGSTVEYSSLLKYTGYYEIKIKEDIFVIVYGKVAENRPIFINFKIKIIDGHLKVDYIKKSLSIQKIDKDFVSSLTSEKQINTIFLKKI